MRTSISLGVTGLVAIACSIALACSDATEADDNASNAGRAGRASVGGAGVDTGVTGALNAAGGSSSRAGSTSSGGESSGAGESSIGSGGAATSGGAGGASSGGSSTAGGAGAADGIIYFSNEGVKAGWSSAKPQSNTNGKVEEVTVPIYKGDTAILTEQTYVKPQGAHSEVVLAKAQSNGEDKYYGHAFYLPMDWSSIDKNATFQQFSPENPAGPWNLNWIQNDHIFIRVAGKHYDCGAIKKGEWIRTVVRFKTSKPGIFEYWVNGVKKWSVTDVDLTIPNGSPSMRWSVGLYVTWWRDQEPGSQLTRQIYHDQLRITSSYETAEPANW